MATYDLKLVHKKVVAEDVAILDFAVSGREKISFLPGQYMNLFIDLKNDGDYSGRSYTIASLPTDDFLSFAIRKKGEFSTAMHNLQEGSVIVADGPSGNLCLPDTSHEIICLAAGIGVTPFYSWVKHVVASKEKIWKLFLLVSNTNDFRAPFLKDLFLLSKNSNGTVDVFSFITQQQTFASDNQAMSRRINEKDIKKVLLKMSRAHVAICGSISFTRDMWRAAKLAGVSEDHITTEAFY
ncbi:MAG: FAD-dependent oxidoreductase [Candidatus Paceibacterota bacterium]|jgi:ferredoxin-NADP reductase